MIQSEYEYLVHISYSSEPQSDLECSYYISVELQQVLVNVIVNVNGKTGVCMVD